MINVVETKCCIFWVKWRGQLKSFFPVCVKIILVKAVYIHLSIIKLFLLLLLFLFKKKALLPTEILLYRTVGSQIQQKALKQSSLDILAATSIIYAKKIALSSPFRRPLVELADFEPGHQKAFCLVKC